ncbi:CRISPR-associated endoribonuclease Cas6 [Thermocrinis sp.]
MRFKLRLVRAMDTDTPISIDYRRRFISLLKKIFSKDFDEDSPKPYTFAVYLGKQARIEGDFVKGVEAINLRFSTGDPQLAIAFYNGALRLIKEQHLHNMNPRLEGALFKVVSIDTEKELQPTGSFKSLSPVVIERDPASKNPEERYATPKDPDFINCLLDNIYKRYKAIIGDGFSLNKLEFEPISIKEEYVRHYEGYIRTFLGSFRLITDNQELLNFVYQYGLGIRTGQGFGYLEVL